MEQEQIMEENVENFTTPDKNKPLRSISIGKAKISVWENRKVLANGDEARFCSYSVEKRYLESDGNWNTTNNFSRSELLDLKEAISRIVVLTEARHF